MANSIFKYTVKRLWNRKQRTTESPAAAAAFGKMPLSTMKVKFADSDTFIYKHVKFTRAEKPVFVKKVNPENKTTEFIQIKRFAGKCQISYQSDLINMSYQEFYKGIF